MEHIKLIINGIMILIMLIVIFKNFSEFFMGLFQFVLYSSSNYASDESSNSDLSARLRFSFFLIGVFILGIINLILIYVEKYGM